MSVARARSDAPVREILAATDFSEQGEAAIRTALAYAAALRARVHLLHVSWPLERDVSRALQRYADEAGPGTRVVVATAGGDPAREIVKYATRHGIDLIVLGGHGRSGVSRALLGSVAERVARTAPCPVLTVPPPEQLRPAEVEAEEAEPTPSSCIVCAGPSLDLVCAACRARIRGEAVERKQREERPGRT
jgi:nucleotide-binding universal stress UspA family protein